MDYVGSGSVDNRPRARFRRVALVCLRPGYAAGRSTALDELASQRGDLLGRRSAAHPFSYPHVAQAAPHLELSPDRRPDGKCEFVSEHRVEVFRGQSIARRHRSGRQRIARLDQPHRSGFAGAIGARTWRPGTSDSERVEGTPGAVSAPGGDFDGIYLRSDPAWLFLSRLRAERGAALSDRRTATLS